MNAPLLVLQRLDLAALCVCVDFQRPHQQVGADAEDPAADGTHPALTEGQVGIYVVRAFVKLREVLASNKELAQKLDQLERKLQTHDQAIVGIFNAIRQLMAPLPSPPPPKGRPIGFTADLEEKPLAEQPKY